MNQEMYRKRLIGLVIALLLEAVLGISLTTILNFNPSKSSVLQDIVLGLHVLIAIGIIIGGIIQTAISVMHHIQKGPVITGFVASLIAFAAGGVAASNGNSVAVFAMGIAFIFAVAGYGYALLMLPVIDPKK